jgi:hypothetical protein
VKKNKSHASSTVALRNKLHLKRHLRLVRALLFLLGDFGDGLRVDPYRCID